MASLEELRARKQEREKAREAELEKLEAEALELEEKELEKGLKQGIDFDVVTTLAGNFVVKKPEFLLAKQFAATEKPGAEEVMNFALPHVTFPERSAARGVVLENAGIAYKLTVALMRLYEADASKKAGK